MPFRSQLAEFATRHPEQAGDADAFVAFLDSHTDVFERRHAVGHFTASCWLVSGDGERVLLTHHRKLERWLQLGGHADGDPAPERTALREAEEESGLTGLTLLPGIFDLDRHLIPARGVDPAHWHYDVRYVIRAGANEEFVVSDESHALAWRRIDTMPEDASLDASIRRMARRWLARGTSPVTA